MILNFYPISTPSNFQNSNIFRNSSSLFLALISQSPKFILRSYIYYDYQLTRSTNVPPFTIGQYQRIIPTPFLRKQVEIYSNSYKKYQSNLASHQFLIILVNGLWMLYYQKGKKKKKKDSLTKRLVTNKKMVSIRPDQLPTIGW